MMQEPTPTPTTMPEPTETPTPGVDDTLKISDHDSTGTDMDDIIPPTVQRDPNFEEELRKARISVSDWKTDFSLHSVPYSEILSGGPPRDGIPPIDNPEFTTFDDANEWLGDQEPVIIFKINGDVRAYPLQILTWHEIVNDVVGGVPVAVTFCPLCNAAITFDRTLDGVVHDFGTSGRLRNSDLIMWDRQTESWWQQFYRRGDCW